MNHHTLAGMAATLPMTASMVSIQQALPRRERQPQEPRQITEAILHQLGVAEQLSERQKQVLSLAAHFGYGAFAGAAYGRLGRHLPLPTGLRGAGYGLLLWATSYAGWLPALGILPFPTRRPPGRNALLIVSHLVWGVGLDLISTRTPQQSKAAAACTPRPAAANRQLQVGRVKS